MSLGWGGILEKLAFYRKKHPEHAEFYDAEELVVHGVQNWISHAIEESERLAVWSAIRSCGKTCFKWRR